MHEIFLPDSSFISDVIKIKGDKARYLATVLRCNPGDVLTIKNNAGLTYSARIIRIKKNEIEAELISRRRSEQIPALPVTLLQGLLKGEKMDIVVQKATELGAAEIIPVITERSQVRQTRKMARWRKIAEEASRQSGRDKIPSVREPATLDKLFLTYPDIPSGILFWEKSGLPIKEAVLKFQGNARIALFTGPEGGFSAREAEIISARGFIIASLGRNILRAETAAITALSIIQYELGCIGRDAPAAH